VPKCGGEKELTKNMHIPEETSLRPHSTIDLAVKIGPSIPAIFDKNTVNLGSTHNNPLKVLHHTNKSKQAIVKNKPKITPQKNRMGKTMHKLYDLEPCNQPEKALTIDFGFDLYQMEDI
jgi:hypothetical protein